MSNLALCRVCFASNIRMQQIANTRYEEIFDKLATKLRTEDGRPQTICFICYSHLQRCSRFMDMARKADEILTQFSRSGIQLTEETITILDRKFVHKLSWTPLNLLSVSEEADGSQMKVEIKEEPCESEVFNVIHEAVDDNKLAERHNIFSVKQEIEGETLASREHVMVKIEPVKQEYEGDFEPEGIRSEEKIYEEVSLTYPEQSERTRYTCTQCDKGYYQKCHLSRHLKMHQPGANGTPPRNYTCEICGKTFSQTSTLKKHFLKHTGEKRFACDLCPARCTQKIDLVRHMRVHSGQKPFTCDICKEAFSRKSNMKLHILTHANSKPFVCHICNNTFSRRYDLNRHYKRKHTGEKPHSCDICNFRSVNASYLKTHMQNRHLKQQGEKPISCNKCDFKCGHINYLKIHDQRKHSSSKAKSRKSKIKKIF